MQCKNYDKDHCLTFRLQQKLQLVQQVDISFQNFLVVKEKFLLLLVLWVDLQWVYLTAIKK